eukprot:TRINITY_DN12343_c0_g1_i1.p1 TRINITY_DN12343_c0_g1~~TRINITY_DN12343_c0_g1_i1.p1  ORF type:complete len:374 (+),score=65.53 TRINITY_DN12343_c0_g1_i1:260-1381(+)
MVGIDGEWTKRDMKHGSCIAWFGAPEVCRANDIKDFLIRENILGERMLAQIWLENIESYMSVDNVAGLVWFDLRPNGTVPKVLSIRLTDLSEDGGTPGGAGHHGGKHHGHHHHSAPAGPRNCSLGPTGLAAFSWLVFFDAIYILGKLIPGFVEDTFVDHWMCLSFFGGFLELLVGMWEVTRNNIYGCTVFSIFGCTWMAYAMRLMMVRTGLLADEATPHGDCARQLWLCGVCVAFLKQTLVMNHVSMMIMVVLIALKICAAFAGFHKALLWCTAFISLGLSGLAFYGFAAQLTNEIHGRVVFPTCPRPQVTTAGIQEAAGASNVLHGKRVALRAHGHGTGGTGSSSDSDSGDDSDGLPHRALTRFRLRHARSM